MKQTIFTAGAAVIGLCAIASPAMADGGMVLQTTQEPVVISAEPEVATVMNLSERLNILKELVRLTSYVQALQLGVPEVTSDDEGLLTVIVNDTMRFPCDGKAGTDGEWCVRHVGGMGESYVDLNTITGFSYDERFAYTLTLMRTRAATYGTDSMPQYDYFLVQIGEVDYQNS